MSHTYANIQSDGSIGNGSFDHVEEDVHMRFHHYWGGERGRMTSIGIESGHNYEGGSAYGNTINIDMNGAKEMVKFLQTWIDGNQKNDDYGEIDEYKVIERSQESKDFEAKQKEYFTSEYKKRMETMRL